MRAAFAGDGHISRAKCCYREISVSIDLPHADKKLVWVHVLGTAMAKVQQLLQASAQPSTTKVSAGHATADSTARGHQSLACSMLRCVPWSLQSSARYTVLNHQRHTMCLRGPAGDERKSICRRALISLIRQSNQAGMAGGWLLLDRFL